MLHFPQRNGPVIAATAPNLPQNAAIMESFGVPSVDTVAELLDQVRSHGRRSFYSPMLKCNIAANFD